MSRSPKPQPVTTESTRGARSQAGGWTATALESALVFLVLFGPLAFGAVEPWSKAILQAVAFLPLPLAAVAYRADNIAPRFLLPVGLFGLALGLLQAQTLIPPGLPSGWLPFSSSEIGLKRGWLHAASCVAILAWAPYSLSNSGQWRRALWLIFGVGAFIALAGLVQSSAGNHWMYGLREVDLLRRFPFGPYYNHNHGAALVSMGAFVGTSLWLSRLGELRYWRNEGRKIDFWATQLLLAMPVGLAWSGLVVSRSRGAWLAAAGAAFVMAGCSLPLLQGRRRRWAAGGALGAVLAMTAAAVYAMWPSDFSTAYRISIYRSITGIVADFPLFGTGLGSFMTVFPAYQEPAVVGLVDHGHNDFLELLVEQGVVGFATACAGLLAFFWRAIARYHAELVFESRCLRGGALAAAFAFLLHGLVDFNGHIPANAALFAILLCVIGQPLGSGGGGEGRPVGFRLAVMALSLTLVWQSAKPALAWALSRGVESIAASEAARRLEQAYAAYPDPPFQRKLARHFLERARTEEHSRVTHLRRALAHVERAGAGDPLNPDTRSLERAILMELGRP